MSQPKIKIKLNKILGSKRKNQTVTPRPMKIKPEVGKEQALFDAAKSGNSEKIIELISSFDSVETENHKGLLDSVTNSLTPLQIAAANGHVMCVQKLIDLGANVDFKDEFGCTALHLAAKNGSHMCLKVLLEARANCHAHIDISVFGKPPYISDLYAPNLKGVERGSTALHLAVKYNHVNCVKELMQFGADCAAVDINGHTSLHIAAKAGLEECALTLLRNSPSQASLFLASFDTCETPLHYAVENRMVECVKELVHLGSDVNHINKYGHSPLHILLCRPKTDVDMEILKLIVLEGFNTDINKPTSKGESPLYLALFNFTDLEIITFLIAYGANTNLNNIYPSLLEYLLSVFVRHDVLKCIMKSMRSLPLLQSLDVCFQSNYPGFAIDDTIRLDWETTGTFVAVMFNEVEIMNSNLEKLGWDTVDHPLPPYVKFLLKDPILDIIYERINEKLQHFRDNFIARASSRFSLKVYRKYENYLLLIKEQIWYEKIACNPRTLQHGCRCTIRDCMSPSNLRHIRKLPLPEKVLSYLLFECEE